MKMTKSEARKHIEVLKSMAAASDAIGRDDWDDSLQAAAKFLQDAVDSEPVAVMHGSDVFQSDHEHFDAVSEFGELLSTFQLGSD